jgi:hypothetical protein
MSMLLMSQTFESTPLNSMAARSRQGIGVARVHEHARRETGCNVVMGDRFIWCGGEVLDPCKTHCIFVNSV